MQATESSERARSLKQEVTVIIPTLNEELGVGTVLDELRTSGYENILLVDGYSKDNTVDLAKSRNIPVLTQHGAGKAGAIRTAIQYVSTPYILLMDGDVTYSAVDIDRFLDHMQEFDEIIGARVHSSGSMSILNKLGNWVINKSFKVLFSKGITDVCSGMYLLRTSFAKTLDIASTSFDVEVEIASQAASKGRISQVPISYGKRAGKTKLHPIKDGLRIFSTILWMANYYNPVVLYSLIVSLAGIPAAGILFWVFAQDAFFGRWHSGFALFGGILMVLAAQAGAVGMMSLLMKRMELRIKEVVRSVQ